MLCVEILVGKFLLQFSKFLDFFPDKNFTYKKLNEKIPDI